MASISSPPRLGCDRHRAQILREPTLGVEAGHGHHLDVRVERAQDRQRGRAERAGAVHEHLAPGSRRMAGDPVQRDRERIREHRLLVRDRVGHLEQHGVVRGHQLAEPTGDVLAHAGVDPRGQPALGERPALTEVTGGAGRADRLDPARPAREPGVEHDAVTDLEPFGFRTERNHVGDHFVPHHVREGDEVLHRVVLVVARPAVLRREARVVEEDLLRLGAADARQPRLRDHPVRTEEAGVVQVHELRRGAGQRLQQAVVGVGLGLRFGCDPEDECAHGRSVRRGGTAGRGAGYRLRMPEEAALVLNSVKVNNRIALFSAFPDRLVIVDSGGTRHIPIGDLARITHKNGIRTGQLGIVTVDGEELVVKGLRARDTPTAYQILVQLASAAH